MNITPLRSALFVFTLGLAGCGGRAPLREAPASPTPVRSVQFREEMAAVVGSGWVGGNRIETLNNGDEIFGAMLRGIRSARKTITFETFVFENGDVPRAFVDALAERARAGVKVHVILDAVGASKSLFYWQELENAGVDLVIYHPPWWLDVTRNNHRSHRKLLVVDGKVGFIGGVGVADYWKGDASTPEEWREVHYRVEGPVVAQLQGAFQDNWMNARKELLLGAEYYPAPVRAGAVTASAFTSSPLRGRGTLEVMNLLAIASARESLDIINAYFLPDRIMVDALCAAARRGVRVRIIMPGPHMDQKMVERQSKKRWKKLLEAGVHLYKYQPTMIHTKLLITDGLFVSVGSGNLDPRALRINDEANLNVLDAGFAREQTRVFERDWAKSLPVVLKDSDIIELPQQLLESPLESQL